MRTNRGHHEFLRPTVVRRWVIYCSIVLLLSVSYGPSILTERKISGYFLSGETHDDLVELLMQYEEQPQQEQRRLGRNPRGNVNAAMAAQLTQSLELESPSQPQEHQGPRNLTLETDRSFQTIHQQHKARNLNVLPKAPLRCATFGNVDTYGSLKFQGGKREDSYAYQICDKVDVYGVISQTANYAGVCLQSWIGNEKEYDVIVFDYDGKPKEHMELALRVRERFPTAQFFVLNRFQPFKVIFKARNRQYRSLDLRLLLGRERGNQKTYNKKRFKKKVTYMRSARLRNSNLRGRFIYKNSKKQIIQQMVQRFNAIEIVIGNENDIELSMLDALDFYNDEGDYLSQKGHELVAEEIKTQIQQANVQPSVAPLGTWGDGDSCHIWSTDGNISGISYGKGIENIQYGKRMHALAFVSTGSWVRVTNPFAEDRHLYVSYAVSPGSTQFHSNANVVIPDAGIDIDLDTRGFDSFAKTNIVSPRTISIGKVPPGSHFMVINPYNDGTIPFYLLGLTITDSKIEPDEYEFLRSFWISQTIYGASS